MIWISYKCTIWSIFGPWLCLKFAKTLCTHICREYENWCNLRILSGKFLQQKTCYPESFFSDSDPFFAMPVFSLHPSIPANLPLLELGRFVGQDLSENKQLTGVQMTPPTPPLHWFINTLQYIALPSCLQWQIHCTVHSVTCTSKYQQVLHILNYNATVSHPCLTLLLPSVAPILGESENIRLEIQVPKNHEWTVISKVCNMSCKMKRF